MKKKKTRLRRRVTAALCALLVLSAVCGAGSVLPERVRDALPDSVHEALAPITAQAAGGDSAIVMGTASVLGQTGDFNNDHTNTQIVHYGGQRWYVVGYNGTGVAANADTMTLISVGNLEVDVQFNPDPSAAGANHYFGSTLQSKVNAFAVAFSSDEKKAVIPRTLASGTYNGADTDVVAGTEVTGASLWPLSTKEATAMNDNLRRLDGGTNRDWAIDFWWLRSPGDDDYGAALVSGDGDVRVGGVNV